MATAVGQQKSHTTKRNTSILTTMARKAGEVVEFVYINELKERVQAWSPDGTLLPDRTLQFFLRSGKDGKTTLIFDCEGNVIRKEKSAVSHTSKGKPTKKLSAAHSACTPESLRPLCARPEDNTPHLELEGSREIRKPRSLNLFERLLAFLVVYSFLVMLLSSSAYLLLWFFARLFA